MSLFCIRRAKHPDWIETTLIKHENKTINYLLIQNEVSLLFVANLGCIEIHPFFSRFTKPDYPDYMIFDLDPKEASFDDVVRVAKEVHVVLEEIEVASYCKTSGATGLHVTVPLGAKYTYFPVLGKGANLEAALRNVAKLLGKN